MSEGATVPFESIRVPVRSIRVEVLEGPDAHQSVERVDRLTIGSGTGNDLVLTDPSVSRYHLELSRVASGFLVVDLGSTNGTHAASVRIERGIVAARTLLRVGHSTLRVDDGDSDVIELRGPSELGELRGQSAVMRQLMAQVERAARARSAVLLVGETGTGKELIARAIHALDRGNDKPLITVDCGAMSASLIASELFGHERGAFTGADRQHVGAFERANGGTLFLDEIGELPVELQSTLLGALERRRFHRVGGKQDIAVDIRVLSATNRDLRAEVNATRFRLDLYYRLSALTLKIPPLRERTEDIPLLVDHFLRECGYEGWMEDLFPAEKMAQLETHFWAGNVRELRNLVESTMAFGEAPASLEDRPRDAAAGEIPADASVDRPYREARAAHLAGFEARYLRRLVERCDHNISLAAREARMDRSYLTSLLKRHKIQ